MPRALELFSGPDDEGISAYLRSLGWKVDTIDINPDYGTTWCMDVLDFDPTSLEHKYDFVWAGVDCSCFSVMTVSKYWTEDGEPRENNWGEQLRLKTIQIIEELKPDFFAIENPRAMMRTRDWPEHWARYTVMYCKYGYPYMKPTDLFGFLPSTWSPKTCKQGTKNCHEPSPRGSKTGVQNPKLTPRERSSYPPALVAEICEHVANAAGLRSWFL